MTHLRTMLSAQARKALVAAAVAGTAATVATGGHYTLVNVLTVAGAVLGAWQATYWTTNADAPGDTPPPASDTPIHDAMIAEYTATPVEPQP
jgi:4-amino-4-deoxy-L-arabinose transferase-like glycosyltransferase